MDHPDPLSDVPVPAIMVRTACRRHRLPLRMRDSEIKHLRRGCSAKPPHGSDGNVVRRLITSLAFKGVIPTGVTATWVISEPVERAVSFSEQLQEPDIDYLITPPGSVIATNWARYGQLR